MTLSIIAAMSKNKVIGKDNQLPWHLSEDLKRFKQITMGHPVIMGRKTFESLGRPLPGRENIILTRDPHFQAEGIRLIHGMNELNEFQNDKKEYFVIGGAEVYAQTLPLVRKLYLTIIQDVFEGDSFFPNCDLEREFEIQDITEPLLSAKDNISYRFVTAIRKDS